MLPSRLPTSNYSLKAGPLCGVAGCSYRVGGETCSRLYQAAARMLGVTADQVTYDVITDYSRLMDVVRSA